MTTRIFISKSKKRKKMTDGSYWYTAMVIYKTKLPNGKYESFTRHEKMGQ